MPNLLQFASRVEAAVVAYTSVRDFANEQEWRAQFEEELKNMAVEYQSYARDRPPLHPTLVALCIVLHRHEDLGSINRSHPDLDEHEFYNPDAQFPKDISDLLPAEADRWWERLEAEEARRQHAAKSTPTEAPPVPLRRVKLIPPAPPAQQKQQGREVPMEVDEGPEASNHAYWFSSNQFLTLEMSPQRHRGSKAAKGAAPNRKRRSEAAQGGSAKRRASSRSGKKQRPDSPEQRTNSPEQRTDTPEQRTDTAEQRTDTPEQPSGDSDADCAEQGPSATYILTCGACEEAGEVCEVVTVGACKRCHKKKLKCSHCPPNPNTKKTDRRTLKPTDVLKFRIAEQEERRTLGNKKGKQRAGNKKGKQCADSSPDAGEPEASASIPSPLGPLAGLRELTLESGGSSTGNTPADSPATSLQPPLPELPASSSPSISSMTRRSSTRLAGVTIQLPATSQLLTARHRQVSYSPSDASPASDDGGNGARIAVLERKQGELDKRITAIETRLNKLGA